MADSATKSMQAILGGSEYDRFQDVVVFDEHDDVDKDGKVIRQFNKNRLEDMCAVANKRWSESASPAMIGPGHTLLPKEAKEVLQPPIWGVAPEFKVGQFGPQNKNGILATFYMKRRIETIDEAGNPRVITGEQALKEFPRASVEIWPSDNVIDWIALGRRRPERDLGIIMCGKNPDGKICYQKDPPGKLAYTMDPTEEPSVGRPGIEDTNSDEELNPEEIKQAERYFKHCMKSGLLQKYSAAFASPTNTALPGGKKEEPVQMAATPEEILQYQAEVRKEADVVVAAVQAKAKGLEAEVAALKAEKAEGERVAQYAKRLNEISASKDINVDEELVFCVSTFKEPVQFQRYTERLEKNSKGKNEPPIGTAMITPAGGSTQDNGQPDLAKADRVIQYLRNHQNENEFAVLGQGAQGAILRYNKALSEVNQGKV